MAKDRKSGDAGSNGPRAETVGAGTDAKEWPPPDLDVLIFPDGQAVAMGDLPSDEDLESWRVAEEEDQARSWLLLVEAHHLCEQTNGTASTRDFRAMVDRIGEEDPYQGRPDEPPEANMARVLACRLYELALDASPDARERIRRAALSFYGPTQVRGKGVEPWRFRRFIMVETILRSARGYFGEQETDADSRLDKIRRDTRRLDPSLTALVDVPANRELILAYLKRDSDLLYAQRFEALAGLVARLGLGEHIGGTTLQTEVSKIRDALDIKFKLKGLPLSSAVKA